jgi:Secreted repeat of unknown function
MLSMTKILIVLTAVAALGATALLATASAHQATAASRAELKVAGHGMKANLIGTTKRSDGTTQVTYAGHPRYTYEDDKKAGQTKGEGSDAFDGEWYVVAPSGKKVDDD